MFGWLNCDHHYFFGIRFADSAITAHNKKREANRVNPELYDMRPVLYCAARVIPQYGSITPKSAALDNEIDSVLQKVMQMELAEKKSVTVKKAGRAGKAYASAGRTTRKVNGTSKKGRAGR